MMRHSCCKLHFGQHLGGEIRGKTAETLLQVTRLCCIVFVVCCRSLLFTLWSPLARRHMPATNTRVSNHWTKLQHICEHIVRRGGAWSIVISREHIYHHLSAQLDHHKCSTWCTHSCIYIVIGDTRRPRTSQASTHKMTISGYGSNRTQHTVLREFECKILH